MQKAETGEELDRSRIPQIIFEKHPDYVELYDKAWELAADHIYHTPGMPKPRYMGEGCNCGRIWIWDTEFMALFCKYAPGLFPGIQSLDNFYGPILDGTPSSQIIQHPDNPAFFPWVETAQGRKEDRKNCKERAPVHFFGRGHRISRLH